MSQHVQLELCDVFLPVKRRRVYGLWGGWGFLLQTGFCEAANNQNPEIGGSQILNEKLYQFISSTQPKHQASQERGEVVKRQRVGV